MLAQKYLEAGLPPFTQFDSFGDGVKRFMVAFDQPLGKCGEPVSAEDLNLAAVLIKEEVQKEFYPAFNAWCQSQSIENLTAMVDGAIDSIYVILWLLHKAGVPVNQCWQEVQRSNMAKLLPDGTYVKNPETGKVMKPEGWTPPNLFAILMEASTNVEYRNGIAYHNPGSRG